MKSFFAKPYIKCVFVIFIIATLLGGLLALLNDLLFVTAEERTMRAVKKIYGKEMNYSIELDVDVDGEAITYQEFGSISKIYLVGNNTATEYDMLFKSTGINGFKGGKVTCWTQVKFANGKYSIERVILESFDKQTFMSKLGDSYYKNFNLVDVTKEYNDGKIFSATDENMIYNPVSGATKSATAGNNAINCVLKYLGEK